MVDFAVVWGQLVFEVLEKDLLVEGVIERGRLVRRGCLVEQVRELSGQLRGHRQLGLGQRAARRSKEVGQNAAEMRQSWDEV
jgi:hypothetical protein